MDKYLELLGYDETQLAYFLSKDFETGGRDPETPHAVAKTLSLSLKQIEERQPLAFELLLLMSLLDRQNIPLLILQGYCFGVRESAETLTEIQLIEGIGILKAFSFISETTDENYDMHRLVQVITRGWLMAQGSMARFASHASSALVAVFIHHRRFVADASNHGDELCRYRRFFSHSRAVIEISELPTEEYPPITANLKYWENIHQLFAEMSRGISIVRRDFPPGICLDSNSTKALASLLKHFYTVGLVLGGIDRFSTLHSKKLEIDVDYHAM